MDPERPRPRRAGTGLGRSLATAAFTLACLGAGAAPAQASNADDGAADTVGVAAPQAAAADADGALGAARPGLAWRWEALPATPFHARPFNTAVATRGAAAAIDYRLWFGDQRTEIGLGFASRDGSGTVLAFRHQVSAQSRLTFDTRWNGNSDAQPGPARKMAFDLGLESSRLQGLAKGTLLRAQLNADSHLALRLRGGRVGLVLSVRITGAE